MQLESTQSLPVDRARAWQALNDPAFLQRCIPGCESFTAVGDDDFEVVILAAVGPVKAKFKGRVQIQETDPPQGYTLRFEGQGGVAGFGKGTAAVRLAPLDAQQTQLSYSVRATVGGKLAQVGARLVDMAANKLAGEFFQRMCTELQQDP